MSECKLVPVEPTAEMLRAAQKNYESDDFTGPASMYRAMLAAAPAPEPRVEQEPVWWGPVLDAAPPAAWDVSGIADQLAQVIADLKIGFVACATCGDQEDTATMDCVSELEKIHAALSAHREQQGGGS